VRARRAGHLARVDAGAVGRAATVLGAGRLRKEDHVDAAVGITLLRQRGDRVARGEPIATVWYNDTRRRDAALAALDGAFTIAPAAPRPAPLVLETIA
jgi:thymidine phosphorylase